MNCNIEPDDKKEFGIQAYKTLVKLYGNKNHYEVLEIKYSVRTLNYPASWECWALAAFMLPANIGEYLRAHNTPMSVLNMKKSMVLAMTDNKTDTLNQPTYKGNYDVEVSELTKMNLVNIIAFYSGYDVGHSTVSL